MKGVVGVVMVGFNTGGDDDDIAGGGPDSGRDAGKDFVIGGGGDVDDVSSLGFLDDVKTKYSIKPIATINTITMSTLCQGNFDLIGVAAASKTFICGISFVLKLIFTFTSSSAITTK